MSDMALLIVKRALRLAREDLGMNPDLGFDLDDAVRILEHARLMLPLAESPSNHGKRSRGDSATSSKLSNVDDGSAQGDSPGKESASSSAASPSAGSNHSGAPVSPTACADETDSSTQREASRRASAVACMRLAVEDAFRDATQPYEARAGDATPATRERREAAVSDSHALHGPLRKLPQGRMVIRGARLLASAMRRFDELQADEEVDPFGTVLHLNVNWATTHLGVARSHGGAFDLPGYDPVTGLLQVKQALKMWRSSLPRAASSRFVDEGSGSAAVTPSAASVATTAGSMFSPSRISALTGSFMSTGSAVAGELASSAAACGVNPTFESDIVAFRDAMAEAEVTAASAQFGHDAKARGDDATLSGSGSGARHRPVLPGFLPAGVSCTLSPMPESASSFASVSGVASATVSALKGLEEGGPDLAADEVGAGVPAAAPVEAPAPPLTRSNTAYKRRGLNSEGLASLLEFFGLDLRRVPGGRVAAVRLMEEAIAKEPLAEEDGVDTTSALLGRRRLELEDGEEEWRVCGSRSIRDVLRRFNVAADAAMDGHRRTTAEMAAALPLPQQDREATAEEAARAEAFLKEAEEAERTQAVAHNAIASRLQKVVESAEAGSSLSTSEAATAADEDGERDLDHLPRAAPGKDRSAAGSGAAPTEHRSATASSSATPTTGKSCSGGAGGSSRAERVRRASGSRQRGEGDAASAAPAAPETGTSRDQTSSRGADTDSLNEADVADVEVIATARSDLTPEGETSSGKTSRGSKGARGPRAALRGSPSGAAVNVRPSGGSAPPPTLDTAASRLGQHEGKGSTPTLSPGGAASRSREHASASREAVLQAAIPSWRAGPPEVGALQAALVAAEAKAQMAQAASHAQASEVAAAASAAEAARAELESQRAELETIKSDRARLEAQLVRLEESIRQQASAAPTKSCCTVG